MKQDYALPAAFSATVLSFVLLGTPGRNVLPSGGADAPSPVVSARTPPDWIALDESLARPNDKGEDINRDRTDGNVSRLPDIPSVSPDLPPFVEPPLPGIQGDKDVVAIPRDWQFQGSGSGPTGPMELSWKMLDRAPHARLQMAPEYPRDLRAREVEGTAVIEFVVDEAGNVHHPVAVSATDSAFAEAAVRAVATWKFDPGTYRGRRVRFRMSVPMVFTLGAD